MAANESIRAMLSEGNGPIAVGRAKEVAARVLAQPRLFRVLIQCLWDDDPGVANRGAHAIERVTRNGEPRAMTQLNAWKSSLLGLLPDAVQNKLRWHLAVVVPRLTLSPHECVRAAQVLESWLEDKSSSIVKTMALQGLSDLAVQAPSLLPTVRDLLRIHSRSGTAAMRARSRILLAKAEKSSLRDLA